MMITVFITNVLVYNRNFYNIPVYQSSYTSQNFYLTACYTHYFDEYDGKSHTHDIV